MVALFVTMHASFDFMRERRSLVSGCVILIIGIALPRPLWPEPVSAVFAAIAWLCFLCARLDSLGRAQKIVELGSGMALLALAVLAPALWLGVSLALSVVALSLRENHWFERARVSLGLGFACPALFYAAVFATGADERTALKLAFHSNAPAFELIDDALGLALLVALSLIALALLDARRQLIERRLSIVLAVAITGVVVARLSFVASVASLPGDLLVWSEPPALVNLLKIKSGQQFYGPMQWANSYSYSPGLELFQYALLRPVHAELSLRSHRLLGLFWQLCSAVVLSRALWHWLGSALREALGTFGYPVLLLGLSGVTYSSLLAPHVHPDHLLLLCFSVAVGLCLEPEPFQKRDWLLLGVVPIAATVFKLTGAGIGVGLLLAVLMERRFHALGIVVLAGVLSLLTIPIFDATLGQFSAYAIHLQASHPIDWEHIALVPRSAAGTIFGVALLTVFVSSLARPSSANCRAARRVLALTACFGAVSLAAFLKHGGRENSLLPLAIGGIAALSTVLAESSASASNALPLVAVFWAALAMSWPSPPIHGETRAALVHAHEREVSFLRDSFARGQRPWSQGTAAWIDAGRRDVPLDRLASASELDLGHFRELGACERRLTNGYYDAFFLSARALSDNPFLRRIRARLESRYHVVETQFGNTNDGYAILARGPQNSEPPPR